MPTTSKQKKPCDQVSLKIAASTKKRIEQLAQATKRAKSFVIEEAINQYLELNEWQTTSIGWGLEDVRAGRVISHEDLDRLPYHPHRWNQESTAKPCFLVFLNAFALLKFVRLNFYQIQVCRRLDEGVYQTYHRFRILMETSNWKWSHWFQMKTFGLRLVLKTMILPEHVWLRGW